MANPLGNMVQEQASSLILSALQAVAGQGANVLRDDARFRALVIDPAWDLMPLPLRLLGRKRLGWDDLFLRVRAEVLEIHQGTVSVRADAGARLLQLVAGSLGGSAATTSSPPTLPAVAPAMARPIAPPSLPPAVQPRLPDRTTGRAAAAVGIDLGTTYSVVAHVDAQGRTWSIPNAAGDILTPSVVLFEEGGTVVGKEAVLAAAMEPERVAECVKRDMGARCYRRKINGEHLPPEVISSIILRSLRADAERKLGSSTAAVITVPAYFDEPRRRATMDAGRLAGLDVLDIINEPTAAAIAYGHQLGYLDRYAKLASDRPLRVLVYDLGGGTFDVTILEIREKSFVALATDGDVSLGGKDWDQALVELAAERFRSQHREDPRENPGTLQEMYLSAESAKRTLSERPRATIFFNHFGARAKVEVTREEFEDATAPLLARSKATMEIVLRQAGLTWEAIDRVLLVGGSTRMPMVLRMIEETTGKTPDRSLSPDEAVAHGAALYADLLMQQRGPRPADGSAPPPPAFSVTNINSHSLGVVGVDTRTQRRVNRVLIRKNTPLPATAVKSFRTYRENQRDVTVRILEGESERPEACTPIGMCKIEPLPPQLPAGWPVEVKYTYQENGVLLVSARLKGQAGAAEARFVRDNSLPEGDMLLWARCVEQLSNE